MKGAVVFAVFVAAVSAGSARAGPPIYDPVALNIGMSCQWQQKCMAKQQKAMKSALKIIDKNKVSSAQVAQCNRNAKRSRYRVDWVGFNNCIRNSRLQITPPPTPAAAPRKRPARPLSVGRGERG